MDQDQTNCTIKTRKVPAQRSTFKLAKQPGLCIASQNKIMQHLFKLYRHLLSSTSEQFVHTYNPLIMLSISANRAGSKHQLIVSIMLTLRKRCYPNSQAQRKLTKFIPNSIQVVPKFVDLLPYYHAVVQPIDTVMPTSNLDFLIPNSIVFVNSRDLF